VQGRWPRGFCARSPHWSFGWGGVRYGSTRAHRVLFEIRRSSLLELNARMRTLRMGEAGG